MSNLDSRAMGTIPVSIATALAIDGLYNRHPEQKPSPKPPVLLGRQLYINARTLFRNIHGSMDREQADKVSPKEYGECLLQEIDEIKSAISQEVNKIEVIVYLPSYKRLAAEMGRGNLRIPRTPIQKKYVQLENDTLQYVFDKYKKAEIKPFIDIDMEIDVVNNQNIFILSHIVHDLLFVKNANNIYLLESHTGKVKGRKQWFTKFATDKNPFIPFNKATLLFFGDSSGIFVPQVIKARQRFLEIAKERKWNYMTSPDRMVMGLNLSKEPHIARTIIEFLR